MAIAALSLGTAGETPALQRDARARRRRPLRDRPRAAPRARRRRARRARLVAAARRRTRRGSPRRPAPHRARRDRPLGRRGGKVYGHTHRHGHEPAAHWHLHVGRPDHHPPPSAHSHLPTILGAAFAISSLRALTLLAPFGEGWRPRRSPRCCCSSPSSASASCCRCRSSASPSPASCPPPSPRASARPPPSSWPARRYCSGDIGSGRSLVEVSRFVPVTPLPSFRLLARKSKSPRMTRAPR